MSLAATMGALRADPWAQHETAEAARKLREVEDFLLELERRFPPGGDRRYYLAADGSIGVRSVYTGSE